MVLESEKNRLGDKTLTSIKDQVFYKMVGHKIGRPVKAISPEEKLIPIILDLETRTAALLTLYKRIPTLFPSLLHICMARLKFSISTAHICKWLCLWRCRPFISSHVEAIPPSLMAIWPFASCLWGLKPSWDQFDWMTFLFVHLLFGGGTTPCTKQVEVYLCECEFEVNWCHMSLIQLGISEMIIRRR